MKILALDIETSPNIAYTWGLWNQNVGLTQVVATSEVMCFAARYLGEKKMHFHSTHKDGKEAMVKAAHALLDEADVVMSYNGRKFDMPHLNREFVELGLNPPSPYHQIDLYTTARRAFRFQSNKLEHVSKQLGLDGKIKHEGFDLWKSCMAGDDAAWKRMERYNRRDVQLLEELYEILKPWVPNHPNVALHNDSDGSCPRCGGSRLQRRGSAFTKVSEYQRYQCLDCGGWSQSTRRERGVGVA